MLQIIYGKNTIQILTCINSKSLQSLEVFELKYHKL